MKNAIVVFAVLLVFSVVGIGIPSRADTSTVSPEISILNPSSSYRPGADILFSVVGPDIPGYIIITDRDGPTPHDIFGLFSITLTANGTGQSWEIPAGVSTGEYLATLNNYIGITAPSISFRVETSDATGVIFSGYSGALNNILGVVVPSVYDEMNVAVYIFAGILVFAMLIRSSEGLLKSRTQAMEADERKRFYNVIGGYTRKVLSSPEPKKAVEPKQTKEEETKEEEAVILPKTDKKPKTFAEALEIANGNYAIAIKLLEEKQ